MNREHLSRREFIGTGAMFASCLMTNRSFAQSADPTEYSISEAGVLIRAGDLSPVDLARAYLDRIDRLNPRVNAFITVTREFALARAQELENELSNGNWRGALHGIPIALKDNIDTAGVRTTAASAVFADRIPEESASVVNRLEDAGAIILGKTNMHEFAYGTTSAISHFGAVRNPWDLGRVSGGSSGGSAAAVAARMCAGALGTDTGGSVRIPAAHCSIVGLKGTYGLASIHGIIPLSVSLDHVGPMCRTVGDTALMLQAIAGFDSRDVASIKTDIPAYANALYRRTSGLRLGIPRAMFYEALDPQILDAINGALQVLGKITVSVSDIELPFASELPLGQLPLETAEAFEYHEALIKEKSDLYDPITLERIMSGLDFPATSYIRAKDQLELARKAIGDVFETVDLLVTPTVPRLPLSIEDAMDPAIELSLLRNTRPFNIYGIPSISVPCGFSDKGLPVGLQISGPALGEINVLALAHAFEQATDWHRRSPNLG